jgi:hypothetical protein
MGAVDGWAAMRAIQRPSVSSSAVAVACSRALTGARTELPAGDAGDRHIGAFSLAAAAAQEQSIPREPSGCRPFELRSSLIPESNAASAGGGDTSALHSRRVTGAVEQLAQAR